MAQPTNTLLRVMVPLIVIAIGVGVVAAVFQNTRGQKPPTSPTPAPQPAATGATGASGTVPTPHAAQPAPTGGPEAAAPAPTGPAVLLEGLRALDVPDTGAGYATLGSLDPAGTLLMRLEFSPVGAGVRTITLARQFDSIKRQGPLVIQREVTANGLPPERAPQTTFTPLAALQVQIDDLPWVDVTGFTEKRDPAGKVTVSFSPCWRELAPGRFEAVIVNKAGERVLRLEREYGLKPGSYVVEVKQKAENLTGRAMRLHWVQFATVDLWPDSATYVGDRRRVRFGYLLDPNVQKGDPTVSSTDFLWARTQALGPKDGPKDVKGDPTYRTLFQVWPNDDSTGGNYRPVWLGASNRYFGAAMFPLVPADKPDPKVFGLAARVQRLLLEPTPESTMALQTGSGEIPLPANGSSDLSFGAYAGPLNRPDLEADPDTAAVGLNGFVVYNLGGSCSFCTFSFLTGILLGILNGIHALVRDWGLSIIVLVFCVRLLLHPVTKWSQIRMQRFSRQMQAMAPKQKKVQEKFANDPKRMREEMGRLWREEGISPTGMLGCLPMFLQTPVWIALYATVYYFFPLRQAPALYGVFQSIQPSSWPTWWFLGDLSEPDRLFYLGKTLFTIPLVGWTVDSLNVLPVILAVVFFIQQKYLTPPPAPGSMTPEQEQQQKIMKWIMVFMFPLLMYKAPAGLTLYFIANSTLGIMESRYIRSHIDKYEKANAGKPGGGGPKKPGGFMAKLQAMAEEKQRRIAEARGMQPPRKRV